MLAFELCLRFGCPSPEELWSRLTPEEWREWIAYDRLRPIGCHEDRWQRAAGAALLWNLQRPCDDAGRPVDAMDATDLMPLHPVERKIVRRAQQAPPASVAQQKAVLGIPHRRSPLP